MVKFYSYLPKKGKEESPRNFCRDLYNRMKFRDLYIKQYALFKRMRFEIVVAGLPKSKNELEDDINYDLPKSTDIHHKKNGTERRAGIKPIPKKMSNIFGTISTKLRFLN